MSPDTSVWVDGHMHQLIDYVINGTRVIANLRGYYTENKEFNGRLVVEI